MNLMLIKMTAATIDVSNLSIPKDWPIKTDIDGHFFVSTAVIFPEYHVYPDRTFFGMCSHQN